MPAGLLRPAVAALAAALLGCPAFNSQNRDVDRAPIFDTGAGATILYPGQSAPTYQGAAHPRQQGRGSFGAPPQAPGATPGAPGASATPGSGPEPAARSSSGAPAARPGSNIAMLGGNTTEEESHVRVEEAPVWWKYVTLPFAVVAAPFAYVAEKALPDREAGPEVPRLENAPPPPPPAPAPTDYESTRLDQMERELAQRGIGEASAPAPGSPPSAGPQRMAALPSLADELAGLRQAAAAPPDRAPAPVSAAPAPRVPEGPGPDPGSAPSGADAERAAASGHVDRNGDGRTDQWIFREGGEIVREQLDEDFDGRPDRTLHYDLASHQVDAIEEDTDFDGRPDTWTTLRGGNVVGRRNDTDGDGQIDTWSFFHDGVVTRLERDTSGDGFRDLVALYVGGRLSREEQDGNADGRADVVRIYDAQERVERVEEDSDGDGRIDRISHYEDGRLRRREILDAQALAPAPALTEQN